KDFLGQDLSVQAYYRQREMSFFPFELRVPVPLVNQSNSKADVFGLKSVIQTVLTPAVSMAWGIDAEMDKGNQKAHGYNQLRYELSGGKVYESKSEDYDYGPSIDTQKIGLFTQFKADMSEDLHSKFGLRYEQIAQKIHDFTPPLETAISRNWSLIRAAVATVEGNGTIPAGTLASLPTVYQKTNFKGGDVDYDAWAANFGLSYDIAPKQLLFFNYSQGYELADTARLMRDAVAPGSLIPKISPIFRLAIGSSTVSGLELEAIKTSSYEIGWRGAVDRFFGNAAIFYNQSDKIYQFNRDFTVDLLNREKRVYGAEADIGYRPTDSLTLGVSHSRAKGESKRANGQGWTAVSAMELSPPKTAAYIDSVFTTALSGSLQAQYIAPYNKADDFDAAEYTTLDGNLNYAFNESSQLKFAATNLLNRRYQTLFHQWAEATYGAASGAPAEGRRLSITYRQIF
ncbi:MAG: TonB-dependent receptor, partial [Proteobacteria bacterium]